MKFYIKRIRKMEQKDIEDIFELIDKNKKNLFEFLKNDGLKVAEEMKRLDEEAENDFYKNTFIIK